MTNKWLLCAAAASPIAAVALLGAIPHGGAATRSGIAPVRATMPVRVVGPPIVPVQSNPASRTGATTPRSGQAPGVGAAPRVPEPVRPVKPPVAVPLTHPEN